MVIYGNYNAPQIFYNLVDIFVFFYLIAAYNITGVIKEDSKYKDFVITCLADLAAPGAIFDADSNAAWITTIG